MFASNFELVQLEQHLLQYRLELYYHKLLPIYVAKIILFCSDWSIFVAASGPIRTNLV